MQARARPGRDSRYSYTPELSADACQVNVIDVWTVGEVKAHGTLGGVVSGVVSVVPRTRAVSAEALPAGVDSPPGVRVGGLRSDSLSRKRVPATEPTWLPLRKIWYAVTPISSTAGDQARTMEMVERPVRRSFVGTLGFLVSGTFRLTPDAVADENETLPAASTEMTV